MKATTKLMVIYLFMILIFTSFIFFFLYIIQKENSLFLLSDLQQRNLIIDTVLNMRKDQSQKVLSEFSHWDEMVRFTQTGDRIWGEYNLSPILTDYHYDFIQVFNGQGKQIYSRFASQDLGRQIPALTPEVFEPFKETRFVTFFMYEKEQLFEFSGVAVQLKKYDNSKEPPSGYLVLGRMWSSDYVKELEDQTKYTINIRRILTQQVIRNNPDYNIQITRFLRDYRGVDIGQLEFLCNNPLLSTARKMGLSTMTWFVIITLLFLSLFYFLVYKWINHPLSQISKSLKLEEQTHLEKLFSSVTEFGEISRLISKSFSQKKQLEEEIEERKKSEARFSKVFQNSPDIIFISTMDDDTIIEVNETFLRSFGYRRSELIGRSTVGLRLWDSIDDCSRIKQHLQDKGKYTNYELKFHKKSGEVVNLLLAIDVINFDNKECLLAMGHDITEKKNLEFQLRQAQKMEAVGTLAGGIAHDFNNILAVILGYLLLVKNEVPADSKTAGDVNEAIKASYRARDLIQQILTYSRSNEQENKPISMPHVLTEAVKLIRASIPQTIEIQTNINSNQMIAADQTQIQQIIINLCTNAYHAMRETGGVLSIRLENVERKELLRKHIPFTFDQYVKLTISDTGQGINPDIRERIFDPYFTTKPKGEGTGMGLAIVHGIVQSYNGIIRFDSKVGEGTTFEIYLPSIDMIPEEIVEDEVIIRTSPARVLFVDDEESLADMYQESLAYYGYEVVAVMSGASALEIFQKDPNRFDVIITDLTMPRMTGMQLAQEILSIRPNIPIILCSGFSDQATKERANVLGIRKVLMKPVVPDEMVAIIEKILTEKVT